MKEAGEQDSAAFPEETGVIPPLGSLGACLFICPVEMIRKLLYFPLFVTLALVHCDP